jgi:hypothetical protein
VDAAQDNDLGVSPGCLTGEGQRVASDPRRRGISPGSGVVAVS